MVFTNYDSILNNIVAGKRREYFWFKVGLPAENTGTPLLLWRSAGIPDAGVKPATKEAPDKTTTGAISLPNPTSPDLSYFVKFGAANTSSEATTTASTVFQLIDILSWTSGLSGTVTTEQTTNLPTTALTRYTNGVGNMLALVCWTATGVTAANVQARYTNQAGTANRNTISTPFFTGIGSYGAGQSRADQVQTLPLQQDDTGVKSVEGVTLSANTGTAGDFGVMIYHPISRVFTSVVTYVERDLVLQTPNLPQKIDNACLAIMAHDDRTGGASTSLTTLGQIVVVEG